MKLLVLTAAIAVLSVSNAAANQVSCVLKPESSPSPLGFKRYTLDRQCSSWEIARAQDAFRSRNPNSQVLGVFPPIGAHDKCIFIIAPKNVVQRSSEQHFSPYGSFRVLIDDHVTHYLIPGSADASICDR